MTQQPKKTLGALGPDGIARSPAVEKRINDAIRHAFSGEAGQYALDYLRSITINNVAGPEVSDAHLRHLEGQRWLVGVIQARLDQGRKGK